MMVAGSVPLDRDTLGEIVDLLAPLMVTMPDRRALLDQALTGTDVLHDIDLHGSTRPFIINMVKTLAVHGEIEPGKQALWVLLESVRDQVGINNQARIDALHDTINVPLAVIDILAPPFTAPPPPPHFVQRPDEFDALVSRLLDPDHAAPVAITATLALQGAGGFGKTTLAQAICHHEPVRSHFTDGILWVQIGQTPNLINLLVNQIELLTGEKPGFSDVNVAAGALRGLLNRQRVLVVLDDVWNDAHAAPFLRAGPTVAYLITTRLQDLAARVQAQPVEVDEMQPSQSVELLTARLEPKPANTQPLRALAQRLGEWPLMLELAGAMLTQRMQHGDTLEGALTYLNKALDKRGAVAFDVKNATKREQAIARTLTVSLDTLDADERAQYTQLAIFPKDTDIPLSTVCALWNCDDFDAEEKVQRFADLSLLKFDLSAGTFRLHDVIRDYLHDQLEDPVAVHGALIDTWGDPHTLPDTYAWRWYSYHLKEAGSTDNLQALLLDFEWIYAKLQATDVNTLLVGYNLLPRNEALQLVQSAIRMSAHVLAIDKTQLAGQLLGRLLIFDDPSVQTLLATAKKWHGTLWLRPLTSNLMPPGGAEIRTLGHASPAMAVAVTPDGRSAISASFDQTMKVWDLETGARTRTLTGHTSYISAVATVGPDGHYVISASFDQTLKIWDLKAGIEVRALEGHTGSVNAVAVTSDGRLAISGSSDSTLKVWDLKTGAEVHTLTGHTGWVNAVAITPNGHYAISGSHDQTLKVWDLETGYEVHTLTNHTARVKAVAVIGSDGRFAISGSEDQTLKVWDLKTGTEVRTLEGHTFWVMAVAVSPDGRFAISASDDLKVWDLAVGIEAHTLEGHTAWVNAVAVSPDGRFAISGSDDRTLKVWDLATGNATRTLEGHAGSVRAVAISLDGRYAISSSYDRTLKVWDLTTGNATRTLEGHNDGVNAVTISSDGLHAISGSDDRTLKVWDLATGNVTRILEGHTDGVRTVATSPDGHYVISGSYDQTLKVWDLATGNAIRTLEGHAGKIYAVTTSPDGRYGISASSDRTLRVWSLGSGFAEIPTDKAQRSEVHILTDHTAPVNAVVVTSNGRFAISASSDQTLKMWDLTTWELVASSNVGDNLLTVAVASDNLTVVTGGTSGRVHFLRLEGV